MSVGPTGTPLACQRLHTNKSLVIGTQNDYTIVLLRSG